MSSNNSQSVPELIHNFIKVGVPLTHNPDSNCVQCCAQNEEIYSRLIPLIAKAEAVVASLDKEKIEAVVEKMDEAMDHPILKMLLKTLKKMKE